MQKKEIYFLIFILVAILAITTIVYFSKKLESFFVPEIQAPTKEYSFENIIYNFWGFVVVKEEDTISVEGIIPEPGKRVADQPRQTIKFIITADTKIVRLKTIDEKIKQVFTNQTVIQLKDLLGLKTDKIDTVKKEAIATDIVILEPLPPMPPRPGTTTSPAATQ